jgi:hypothetical protein
MTALRRFIRPTLAALALGLGARVAAQNEMPKGSPFMPAGGGGAAASAPNEVIEFAAVRTIGSKTEINLYDTQGKKGHWIAVGATADGMTVVGYDARREQVTAKIGDAQKTLPLRKARAAAGGPSPLVLSQPAMSFNTPPPVAQPAVAMPLPATNSAPGAENAIIAAPTQPAPTPAQPTTPLSIARQEEEARMLVSDLLEIGMAQRKVYEEKQKQASDPNAVPAQPPTPNPQGPGTQPNDE